MGDTKTDTEVTELSQSVSKSRRQIFWNQMRVRLPVVLLLVLLLTPNRPWILFGIPLILLGQGIRAWAVGWLNKDRQLATRGPYGFCRNPLYLGTFLSSIGLCLLVGRWPWAIVFVVLFAIIYIPTIRQEEDYLIKVYGDSFREYMAQVPSFLPRLIPAKLGEAGQWSWRQLVTNEEHRTWIALVIFLILMGVRARLIN